MAATTIHLQGLTDREACIDAMYRFVEGLDDGNEDLLNSAFTEDASFDVTAFKVVGLPMELDIISGREKLVPHLMQTVGTSIDSMHQLTNFRVNLNGDRASLTTYVLAQHFRAGEGHAPEKTDQLLMGNRIRADLVRAEEGLWRIQKAELKNQWSLGTTDVFKH